MFCPNCESEYVEGVTTCAGCGGVDLVAKLKPDEIIPPGDDQAAIQLQGISRTIEVAGREFDLSGAFALNEAVQIRADLEANGFGALFEEITDIEFPGGQIRYKVMVASAVQEKAQTLISQILKEHEPEEAGELSELSADECPACGSHVPMDAEECPDCGLFVGAGE